MTTNKDVQTRLRVALDATIPQLLSNENPLNDATDQSALSDDEPVILAFARSDASESRTGPPLWRMLGAAAAGVALVGGLTIAQRLPNDSAPAAQAPTPSTTAPPPSTQDATTASERTQAVSDIGASEDSKLLTWLYSDLGLSTAEESLWLMSGRVSEPAIGECMSDAGFPYSPRLDSGQLQPSQSMPPQEFASQFGFGVTMYALDLIPPLDDPNATYKSSLSETERIAFDETYKSCTGSLPVINPDVLLGPASGNAMAVVREDGEYRAVIDNDERVQAALTEWKACMTTSGFSYDSPDAMRNSFYDRMGDLSPDELQALHDEEVNVATANVLCEAPYTETVRQVVDDRFSEFKTLYETALSTGATPDANG